jgi:hypothetical protein
MTENPDMSCAELAEVAAELALGVLTGRERADAVAHLDRCDNCREHVRQLMVTTEGLLGLLPQKEPPPGFETRVLDRLGMSAPGSFGAGLSGAGLSGTGLSGTGLSGTGPQPAGLEPRGPLRALRPSGRSSGPGRPVLSKRPGRSPVPYGMAPSRPARPSFSKRTLAAAAVALAVVTAGLGGWGVGFGMSSHSVASAPAPALLSAAFLTPDHQDAGQVLLYQGMLYMSIDLPSGDGMVNCQIIGSEGKSSAGWFQLKGGYGGWVSPIPGNLGSVRGARLVTPSGTVLAAATFG